MKKALLLPFLICPLIATVANAQWCTPSTAIPYNANMPGITHVSLNTIDRFSTDLENYPNNSYVNTGLTTELTPGQTYNFSITFTIDPQICPDMNIRVWIDYNQDYQLDDAGETVISANNRLPGIFDASFTVPANVMTGSTRMRVTAKMSPNGGHTLPTPCDMPADPFGYHGEIEDYDIVITSPTGISNLVQESTLKSYLHNDKLKFSFTSRESTIASILLYNIQGKLVSEILSSQRILPGEHQFEKSIGEANIQQGVYMAVLIFDNEKHVSRIVIN